MNAPFCVTLQLASPVILGDGFLTLDALLASMAYKQHGDVVRSHAEVPLQRIGSVYAGSAGFLNALEKTTSAHFKRSFNMRELADYRFIVADTGRNADKESGNPLVDQVRGDYQRQIDTYTAIAAEHITWYGRGDADRVRDLLTDLHGVGRKVRHGWGRVHEVDVETLDEEEDASLMRMHRGELQPMRPIPLDEWEALGHKVDSSLCIGNYAATLPYFSAPRVRCVIPPSRQIFWSF